MLILAPTCLVALFWPARRIILKRHGIPSSSSAATVPITTTSTQASPAPAIETPLEAYLPQKPFLTIYRGGMMVITCLAILAVDFQIFPRRFAKVETWGTSLMDLGVGSFVFSMGLVSARGPLKDRFLRRTPTLLVALRRSLRQTTSVLLLGMLRLLLVKAVDYHEHTSEYGVHWNFFMTLGFLPPFVSLFNFLERYASSSALALAVGFVYQGFLSYTPLAEFILTAPRTSIIAMNKEGIFSFFGYLAIFLSGQTTGLYTLPSTPRSIRIPFVQRLLGLSSSQSSTSMASLSPASQLATSRKAMLTYLLFAGVAHTTLFVICTHVRGLNMTVSRRLANLPYVLWVSSYNLLFILLYLLVDMTFFPGPNSHHNASSWSSSTSSSQSPTSGFSLSPSSSALSTPVRYEDSVPRGLQAVNENGLAVFLLANLLTGAVNLSINTLEIRNIEALLVLIAYAAVLAVFAGFAKSRGWRLRI
ncbi:GWT1-domain-containing protein [Limtongia smithiae]|uniref:GWT1-domain-containing protein n=1 Tax=Limtongia smithiae TaxID=1125753 RepID=UPI0034CFFD49